MNKNNRIVFMGTPQFAVPTLQALVDNGFNVVGVFTQPDKPKGRGGKVQKSEVKQLAEALNIPVFQPIKIRLDGYEMLKSLQPDYCVTAAFGQILSQDILDIPKATINVHASLLPKHRGSAPVQWAILNGDSTTGVTTMLTDKGIDTGKMLLKAECPIEKYDTAETLLNKLSKIGAELLIETLNNFENIVPEQQNDELSTYDPMLKKEMGQISFNSSAINICRQVQAMQPWPKAYFNLINGDLIKVTRVEILNENSTKPAGTVVTANNKTGIIVATSTQNLLISTLQAPNKKEMDSKAYLLGNSVLEGKNITEAFN